MANTVFKIKRSTVPGRIPLSSDLEVGELAINLADELLYSKNTSNTVFAVGAQQGNNTSSSQIFPFGDYGNLNSISVDAFGVSTNYSFDCGVAGLVQKIDLNVNYNYTYSFT